MTSYENEQARLMAPTLAERLMAPNGPGIAVICGLLAALIAAVVVVSRHPAAAGAAGAIFALAFGIFILRHPAALLWTLVLTTPFADSDRVALDIGGTKIRPYEVLAIFGALGIVWHFLTRQRVPMRQIAWRFRGLICVLLLVIAAKVVSLMSITTLPAFMTRAFSAKYIVFIAMQFAAAIVCASFIESRERLQQAIRIWIHMSNLINLWAMIQIILANTLGWEDMIWHREIFPLGRPYSVFREPDVLGCYYAAMIALIVPLVVARVRFINRAYLWMTLIGHLIFCVLVVVRAAWVAVPIALGLYVLLSVTLNRFRAVMPYLNGALAVVVLAIFGLVMVAPSTANAIFSRFASVSNLKAESGAAYRMMELEVQTKMVLHPTYATGGPMTTAFGRGDFSWSYWAPEVIPEEDFDQAAKGRRPGDVLINAGFNMPLAIQFDNGLVGLALHASFFVMLTVTFVRTLRRTRDPAMQAMLMGTFLPIVAILVCYQFSYDPLFLTLWILLGFHLAAVYHAEAEENQKLKGDVVEAH